MSGMVTLEVARGHIENEQTLVAYEIPFTEGMSVLDALIWVRSNMDPSLVFRYSCINANACKECSVVVDGVVTYACAERLAQSGARVQPLAGKVLVRDLVTDISPSRERLSALLSR